MEIDMSKLLEVTSINFYLDQSKRTQIDQNGLISERIFGTTRSYKCSCGRYSSKRLYSGKVCPDCRVKCQDSFIRYKTFAKILLNTINIHPLKINILKKDIPSKYFNIMISNKNIDDYYHFYIKYDCLTDSLLYDYDKFDGCIDIKITGIFSFYIAINSIKNSEFVNKLLKYYITEILVIPPQSRLSINDQKTKKIIVSKIDRCYVAILTKKQFQKTNLTDKKFITKLYDEKDFDYSLYDIITRNNQVLINTLYNTIDESISGKTGGVRSNYLGLQIDFSARTTIIPNTNLKTYQIRIPKQIAKKLYSLEYLYYLNTVKCLKINDLKSISNDLDLDSNSQYFTDFLEYYFNPKNTKLKYRILLFNRQPTLWRFGIGGFEVFISDSDCIELSPLCIGPFAADFDGDNCPLYKLHSEQALDEILENLFIGNEVFLDHNDDFLHILSKETSYVFNILIEKFSNELYKEITIKNISDLQFDYDLINNPFDTLVTIESLNITETYGVVLLNKLCGFNDIKLNSDSKIMDLNKEIYNNSKNSVEYHDILSEVNKNLHWICMCQNTVPFSLPFYDVLNIERDNDSLLNKLPRNPIVGYYIYQSEIDKVYSKLPKKTKLYNLQKAKFSKTQFARTLLSIGYIADNNNLVFPEPVLEPLLSGLSKETYFKTSYGTRKGLIDKEKSVPKSGELERSMTFNISPVEIFEKDCCDNIGFNITVNNINHAKSLVGRFIKQDNDWIEITDDSYTSLVDLSIFIRSPITCRTKYYKICAKCFGKTRMKTKYVGVSTAQYVTERLTQLAMSSFHTSGSAIFRMNNDFYKFIKDKLYDIINTENYFDLIFSENIPNTIYDVITELESFVSINNNIVRFNNINNQIENEDVGKSMIAITDINKRNAKIIYNINETYDIFINTLLELGDIKSVFIECILANMFLVNNEIYRYARIKNKDIIPNSKLSSKMIVNHISPILTMLYRPNKNNYKNNMNNKDYEDYCLSNREKISIFEKIWFNLL